MIAPAHITFGLLIYLILEYIGVSPFNFWFLIAAILISFVIDLDHLIVYYIRKARGERLPHFIKWVMNSKARSNITHSAPIAILVTLLILLVNFNLGVLYFFLHIGHILLDLLDKEGTPALWPFSKKHYSGPLTFFSKKTIMLFLISIILDVLLIFNLLF
jgi:membrane-bound metal-dependent hydrolase YbcI (DUF457 family)